MDDLREFYERYITAFNGGDRDGFTGFFHLPATLVHRATYDQRRAGRNLVVLTDPGQLLVPLPGHWERTTIDAVLPLDEAAGFEARAELTQHHPDRPGLIATVTRWHVDGSPYEQLHVLYLLTRENGRLGIKAMVELAAAERAGPDPT